MWGTAEGGCSTWFRFLEHYGEIRNMQKRALQMDATLSCLYMEAVRFQISSSLSWVMWPSSTR